MSKKKIVYLDNAATTNLSEGVKKIIRGSLKTYGNPNSAHLIGQTAAKEMLIARCDVARKMFSATREQIIFTSSGSEANTLAIIGLEHCLKASGKTHIITSPYEHSSVINAMKEMEYRGFDITYLPVKNGYVDPKDVERAITEKTGLVSIMYVNNETGAVNNIPKIGNICRRKSVFFHTDCVQAALEFRLDNIPADFISISGHKLHAPKGIGVLYAKYPSVLNSVIFGGQQELGLRGGTENLIYIKALAQAVKEISDVGQTTVIEKNKKNFALFIEGVKNIECVHFNLPKYHSDKIVNLRFDGVDAETLTLMLSGMGVMVSSGSACDSHSSSPSHTLMAIGLTEEQARESIRVSFSMYNTKEDIIYAVEKIKECVETLRNLSQ